MAVKIAKKIVGVALAEEKKVEEPVQISFPFPETLGRLEKLTGNTYKIKTPVTEHALYITINDLIMDEGTPQEHKRPFEIFINSKNMEHFQWIVALTRVMSAVFRKGGDITFLVEELRSVFDPNGGYFKKGGRYIPSLVAEIGEVLERHLQEIGMLKPKVLDKHQKQWIDEKTKEFLTKNQTSVSAQNNEAISEYPAESKMCHKCKTKAMIMMDGCLTCLSCGDSKCG